MNQISLTKDMQAMRKAARTALNDIFARRLNAILGPMAAVHTRKAAEAQRVLEGATSILLAPEARARGLEEVVLAQSVIERAERQAQQLAALEIERQDAQAAIAAATNPIELRAVLSAYGVE